MARKTINTKKSGSNLIVNDQTIARILESVKNLLETHADEIASAIEESDDRALTVGIPLSFDCSESAPEIEVGFRFSQAVTDKRTIMCDNPDQGTFAIFDPEALREKKEAEAAAHENEGGDEPTKGRKSRKKSEDEAPPAE